jgi:hypothetical protein
MQITTSGVQLLNVRFGSKADISRLIRSPDRLGQSARVVR